MRRTVLAVTVLLLSFGAGLPKSASSVDPADTVFLNGNIYTVNERQPHAQAVAVKSGRIVFVGSNDQSKQYTGPNTRVVDLHGDTVVPGMTDSHYHLTG